jgi:hypothetical protein
MDIGRTSLLKHTINTGDAMPEAKGFYAVGPEKAEFIRNEIKDMLNRGIIRPSVSPWAAPVVLIQKKEGTFRFCVNYLFNLASSPNFIVLGQMTIITKIKVHKTGLKRAQRCRIDSRKSKN